MIIGATFYVDPSSAILNVCFLMCSTKKKNPLAMVFSFSTILFLLMSSGSDLNEQLNNITNYVNLKDPSENIGIYFFMSVSNFNFNNGNFFKYTY
jgi:hypothetical protein